MEKFLTYQGAEIFYKVEGEGPFVCFIHGFAEDGTIWNELTNHLKKNFRIIIPDIPGSGPSSVLRLSASIDDYAECVKAVLDAEQVNNCTMIGHSMGGYITLAVADKYAHLLRSFGLFHSTAYADSDEKKEARRKSIRFINEHGSLAFIQQTTPNLFSEYSRNQNPGIVKEFVDKYCDFSPEILTSYYEAMINRPDRTKVLNEFPRPILFIIGVQDKAVPLEQSLQICHMPIQSHIHIMENAAHLGMIEEPIQGRQFVENFLLQTT